MNIRKTMMIKEAIEADGVGKACDPIVRVAVVAVIQNPFAGRFVEDLSSLFEFGGQLGEKTNGGRRKYAGRTTRQLRQSSNRRRRRRYGSTAVRYSIPKWASRCAQRLAAARH